MQTGWRIGSLFGIPFYIDPSWFFIVTLVTFVNGLEWQGAYSDWGPVLPWIAGLSMALLLFGSVLLHELGHSVIARSQGIRVNSITLFLFGGIAAIDHESKTPGKAFQVAIAGPAVSFGLFGLLFALLGVLPSGSPAQVLASDLARINLVLGLFNLIPGLPLDGGQILKAAVWKITGDRFQGVHWAAKTGSVLGWIAITLGLATVFLADNFSGLWIALLGWFGVRNANAYDRMTNLQEALVSLHAVDAMTRDFRVVDANMTLRQFADDYLLEESRSSVYFAASDGRYRGLVSVDDLRRVERSQWDIQTLQSIVHPLTDIAAVEEKTPLIEVIIKMEAQQLQRITTLSPAGAVAGVIDRGDIVRALAKKLNFAISEGDIKRIKEEGSYPPGLQLQVIAQATADSLATSTR